MQQRRGLQKQPQPVEFASGFGYVEGANQASQFGNRVRGTGRIRGLVEDQLAALVDAQANAIAVIEGFRGDGFAIDKDAVKLAAILDAQPARYGRNGSAPSRDPQVVEGEVVTGLCTAPDQERQLVDRDHLPGAV